MRLMLSSGAGYSHIAPMLPLAVAARDAGDDVVLVTGPDAVHYAENAGVPAAGVGPPRDAVADAGTWQRARAEMTGMTPQERLSHMIATYMVGLGAATRLDDMLAFVRSWKPDLVVANLAERAAVMAACLAGVPYAMHAIGPPKSAATMQQAWQVAEDIVRRYGADGLPPRDNVPYLDIWPDRLRPGGVAWEYSRRWPLRPEGVLPEPGPRPDILDGLPYEHTVYLTIGTTHNTRPDVLESMLTALRDEEINVIATTGADGDPERFGPQPPHVRIERFVPQQRLLPAVDAVVCHGGSATALGALAHGVPLVIAPLATDHFEVAAQVRDARAGLVAGADDPGGLREAVRAVVPDRSLRASAQTTAGQIAAMPRPQAVLHRLRAYAQHANR